MGSCRVDDGWYSTSKKNAHIFENPRTPPSRNTWIWFAYCHRCIAPYRCTMLVFSSREFRKVRVLLGAGEYFAGSSARVIGGHVRAMKNGVKNETTAERGAAAFSVSLSRVVFYSTTSREIKIMNTTSNYNKFTYSSFEYNFVSKVGRSYPASLSLSFRNKRNESVPVLLL